jgi:hypothetical protein
MRRERPQAQQLGWTSCVSKHCRRLHDRFRAWQTVLVGIGVSAYVSYRYKVEDSIKKLESSPADPKNKAAQDAAGC